MIVARALALVLVAEAPLPAEIDRERLVEVVRARSPELAVERAEIEVVRAQEVQAGILPNPELRYIGWGRLTGNDTAINAQQHQYELALPVLLAGQRGLRRRAATAITRVAEADACVAMHALAGEALVRFEALLAAQARLEILEEGERALVATEALTRARAGLGAQTQYDALRVATERETFAVELSDARSAATDAAGRLATIVGAPGWRPFARGELEDIEHAPRRDAAELWRTHGKYAPMLEAATRARTAAAAQTRAARRERWPIPTISFGSYATVAPTSSSLVASISVPLPVFDRGQGALARARAVERSTARRVDAVERRVQSELQRALDVLAVRQDSTRTFRRSALARAPELRAMAQDAYRGGASTVIELLDAERAWLDVRLRWVDLLERLAIARLDVELASGALKERVCRG